MRLTVQTEPGVIELNFMWLPTWIGMNNLIKKEIEEKVGVLFLSRVINDTTLDELDEAIIEMLQAKFPSIHFEDYLRALKHVRQDEEG